MKFRLLIGCLLLLCTVFSFAKSKSDSLYRKNFYYLLKFVSDSTSPNVYQQEEFVLITNGKSSLFTDVVNKKADSMEAEIRNDFIKNKKSVYSFKGVPHAKFSFYIKKDLETNVIKVFDKIGNKNFVYSEIKDSYKWKILSETKVISGLHCQMAKTEVYGRTFIAWFAKEIPIQDGPYKFSGLPGLILELYDDKKQYHFEINKFDPKEKLISSDLPEYRLHKIVETKKETFVNAKKNYTDNTIERLKNSFLASSMTEEKVKELRERIKKNNNPLELKP